MRPTNHTPDSKRMRRCDPTARSITRLGLLCLSILVGQTHCQREAPRLEGLRAALRGLDTTNEGLRSSLLEIVSGVERKISQGDAAGAAQLLNGLIHVSFAAREDYLADDAVASVFEAAVATAEDHKLEGLQAVKFPKSECNFATLRCDISNPNTTCWEVFDENGQRRGCVTSSRPYKPTAEQTPEK